MILSLYIVYKDIEAKYYSSDGKTLFSVKDSSPHLRISAKCEMLAFSCFNGLKSLITFTFEDNPNLTKIESTCFQHCENLIIINLTMCSKLKLISMWAFSNCDKVSQILLPNGLREIQYSAFAWLDIVTSVTIPSSLHILGESAFSACYKLKEVIFEENSSLISLESSCFSSTAITSFQIPEKVSNVSGNALPLDKLINLTAHPKNDHLILEDKELYSTDRSILFFVYNKSFDTYLIPEFVIVLGDYCFYYSSFSKIIIHNSVRTIGNYCFSNLNIFEIELPNSVTSIGEGCFYCTNLRSFLFPKSILSIPRLCFGRTRIVSLTLPENIKMIESCAFDMCHFLINVTILGPLEYIGFDAFLGCYPLKLIVFPNIPMNISSTYFPDHTTLSFNCKILFSKEVIYDKINVIVSFLNASDLILTEESFIMNSNKTEIYGFWGLNFDSVMIPKAVTTIKESAFENSTVPILIFEKDSKLSIIEKYAFRNCLELSTLTITCSNLGYLGAALFKDCISLTSVSFGISISLL